MSEHRPIISIHVPREGHDHPLTRVVYPVPEFQSTCPARGTTRVRIKRSLTSRHFNPRAPRGARHKISRQNEHQQQFQSTCPARGTTMIQTPCAHKILISIHVPREGHDDKYKKKYIKRVKISIHVPREGHDPRFNYGQPDREQFQSTCPARGTTYGMDSATAFAEISIHVPREGHDTGWYLRNDIIWIFQSTCPARGTTGTPSASE